MAERTVVATHCPTVYSPKDASVELKCLLAASVQEMQAVVARYGVRITRLDAVKIRAPECNL